MKKSMLNCVIVVIFVAVCGGFVQISYGERDIMAFWDFGPTDAYTEEVLIDNVSGVPLVELKGDVKDDNGKTGVYYVDIEGVAHPAGRAGAWNNVSSDSAMLVTLNTTGWKDITIRWNYNSENTEGDLGPGTFDMDIRSGGVGDWTHVEVNRVLVRDSQWHRYYRDLSNYGDIENRDFVEIRFRGFSQGDESGGDFLVDNIELVGTPFESSLRLVHPNGDFDDNEVPGGDVYRIEWSSFSVSSVNVDFSLDYGGSWEEIDTVENVNYYDWDVPDANSFGAMVRITNAYNPSVSDISDRAFRIYHCSLIFDLNGDCVIDMEDIALLASEWMVCGKPEDMDCL